MTAEERRRSNLASVDAFARRRERRLVLRLEHHVHDLEDSAVARIVWDNLAILRVALREEAARGDHGRIRRAEDRRPAWAPGRSD